jgi:uncharacterized protein (TIGR00725 family)
MRNKIITIFGSAFVKPGEPLYNEIESLGKLLAEAGYDVCSGGYGGVMEAVSKGAKSAGGKTIGITVTGKTEKANKFVDEEVQMPNLMERITELIAIADGYVILKGGTGTLVELAVALELMNKNLLPEKPIILYGNFWYNLIEILKQDSEKLAKLIERNVKFAELPEDVVKTLNKHIEQNK